MIITESQIIALVGFAGVLLGTFLSGLIGFVTAKRRNNLEARIEICKYREKWLEQLRTEIVLLNTLCIEAISSNLTKVDKRNFFQHMSRITLLVSDTNPHYQSLRDSMKFTMDTLVETDRRDVKLADEFESKEPFLIISKRILKEEWDEIQSLLYKKKKKK